MIFLEVPFSEKEEAKRLGAKWHAEQKKWYVPVGVDPAMLQKWLPFDDKRLWQDSFKPMMMPKEYSDYGIFVEYSRSNGFSVYQGWSRPKVASDENNIWQAYLGVPRFHREFELFQIKMSKFPNKTRNHEKILDFLREALFETWQDCLSTQEDRSHPDYPKWEDYVCACISDLSNWMTERSFTRVWDDTHGRWAIGDKRSGW